MQYYSLTEQDQEAFERDGYFFVRGLFDKEEAGLLARAMEVDPASSATPTRCATAAGASTRIALWNHPGNSIYGMAARSHRLVDTMESLLGGEVYHYHSKLTAKDPFEGGAWEWHQDYGYWYKQRLPVPADGQLHDRARPFRPREWLPAGAQGLACDGPQSITFISTASRSVPIRRASRWR